jgi:hypothetical protein
MIHSARGGRHCLSRTASSMRDRLFIAHAQSVSRSSPHQLAPAYSLYKTLLGRLADTRDAARATGLESAQALETCFARPPSHPQSHTLDSRYTSSTLTRPRTSKRTRQSRPSRIARSSWLNADCPSESTTFLAASRACESMLRACHRPRASRGSLLVPRGVWTLCCGCLTCKSCYCCW